MQGLRTRLGAALATCLVAVPATALTATETRAFDPNQKVCERVETTGSRVAVKRVCLTRVQWAEKRKAEQAFTSEIQRGMGGNRCTSGLGGARRGAPSC